MTARICIHGKWTSKDAVVWGSGLHHKYAGEDFLGLLQIADLSCAYFDSGSTSQKGVLFGLFAAVVLGCREEMPFLIEQWGKLWREPEVAAASWSVQGGFGIKQKSIAVTPKMSSATE